MPNLTSNSTNVEGGIITCSNNSTTSDANLAYLIFNDIDNQTKVYCANTLAIYKINFPYSLKITGLKFRNGYYYPGGPYACQQASFFTDESETIRIGDHIEGLNSSHVNSIITITGIPSSGVITNSLYFKGYQPGTAPNTNIYGIEITAKRLVSALNSITFPLTYSSSDSYAASFSYINGASTNAYISSKTSTGLSLDGVDTNSSSATWITVGY